MWEGRQCNYRTFVHMNTYTLEWFPGRIVRNILQVSTRAQIHFIRIMDKNAYNISISHSRDKTTVL